MLNLHLSLELSLLMEETLLHKVCFCYLVCNNFSISIFSQARRNGKTGCSCCEEQNLSPLKTSALESCQLQISHIKYTACLPAAACLKKYLVCKFYHNVSGIVNPYYCHFLYDEGGNYFSYLFVSFHSIFE